MAAPSVLDRASANNGADTSWTHTITLPGSISAGERLIVVFSLDGYRNPITPVIDTAYSGTKWEQVGSGAYSTTVYGFVYTKVAEGSGNDALRLVTVPADGSSHISFRIDAAGSVEVATSNGSSTNSAPPSLTHTGGNIDTLWIVARCGDGTVQATAAPSGYSNLTTRNGYSSSYGASTATAELTTTADGSETPGTFTSNTEQWVCFTIAVFADSTSSTRATQELVEVVSDDTPTAAVTQQVVEVVSDDTATAAVTQLVVEVVSSTAEGWDRQGTASVSAALTLTSQGTKGGKGPSSISHAATLSATGLRGGAATLSAATSITVTHRAGRRAAPTINVDSGIAAAGEGGEQTGTPAMQLILVC